MGARSACKIFEKISDCLKHIMSTHYKVPLIVKVLDDFLFIAESSSDCRYGLECFKHLCKRTGIPLAHHKTVGPTHELDFLGIQINTTTATASLPSDKLVNYLEVVSHLADAASCSLRELKSLIGKLQFACTIIPSGRCFIRRLHDLTIGKTKPNTVIVLPLWAKEDLQLWKSFLTTFNGRALYNFVWKGTSDDLHLYSDSSKSGFGGVYGSHFIQGKFPENWRCLNIATLELYPIYALMYIFRSSSANSQIIFHCDNEAVVSIINNKTSKDPRLMRLLRPLILVLMEYNIIFKCVHIPGTANIICDFLSRSQVDSNFLSRHNLDLIPTPLPPQICPGNFSL